MAGNYKISRFSAHSPVKTSDDNHNSHGVYHTCNSLNIFCNPDGGVCIRNRVCIDNKTGCSKDRDDSNIAVVHNNCNAGMVDKDSSMETGYNRNYRSRSGLKKNQPAIMVQTMTMIFQ